MWTFLFGQLKPRQYLINALLVRYITIVSVVVSGAHALDIGL